MNSAVIFNLIFFFIKLEITVVVKNLFVKVIGIFTETFFQRVVRISACFIISLSSSAKTSKDTGFELHFETTFFEYSK